MKRFAYVALISILLFDGSVANAFVRDNVLPVLPSWIQEYFKGMIKIRGTDHHIRLKDGIEFVVGSDIWRVGEKYVNDSHWLALNCNSAKCSFEPATLKIKSEFRQYRYADKPVIGQKLLFQKDLPSLGKVLAWFPLQNKPTWLKTGEVITYYSIEQPLKRPETQSSLDSLVTLPDSSRAVFVLMAYSWESFINSYNRSGEPDVVFLQLRAEGKRQFLLGHVGGCNGEIPVGFKQYLHWAGDLDGDNKADYLISFIDSDGSVHLYLSSAAKKSQLVGLAGSHDIPPLGGECDGGGWYFEPE